MGKVGAKGFSEPHVSEAPRTSVEEKSKKVSRGLISLRSCQISLTSCVTLVLVAKYNELTYKGDASRGVP